MYALAVSPDGKSVAFGGGDYSVRVHDAASGERRLAMPVCVCVCVRVGVREREGERESVCVCV